MVQWLYMMVRHKTWILVILFNFIFFFLSNFFLLIHTARATSPPAVDDVFINDSAYTYTDTYTTSNPIIPNIAATRTIFVNGRVSDADGVGTGFGDGDLASVNLRFYRSTVGAGCTADPNDCYLVSCAVSSNTSTILNYSCSVDLQYFVDSTTVSSAYNGDTWKADVLVTDDTAQTGSLIKQTEMETVLSIYIPTTIDFGARSNGELSTGVNNAEMTFTQQGNDLADVEVLGANINCSYHGVIPVGDFKWSLTDVGWSDETAQSLSTTATQTNVDLGTDDDAGLTKKLYWNIRIPTVANGTCSGPITIVAIPG